MLIKVIVMGFLSYYKMLLRSFDSEIRRNALNPTTKSYYRSHRNGEQDCQLDAIKLAS